MDDRRFNKILVQAGNKNMPLLASMSPIRTTNYIIRLLFDMYSHQSVLKIDWFSGEVMFIYHM